MQIQVEIKDLERITQAFKRAPATVEPILQRALAASSAILAKHTLKGDPIPWRTGNLLHSFRATNARLETRWFPTAHYAIYVHEGTSRGIQPNPFMPIILERSMREINEVFGQAMEQITQAIAS